MRHYIYPAANRKTSAFANLSPSKETSVAWYRHLRLAGAFVLAALSASAIAETHFCIAGDLDHMTTTAVAACQAKMSGVRELVRQRGVPDDWHFVVVCDEAGWKDYASLPGASSGGLANTAFHTDAELHWTFVRGSQLDAAGIPVPSSYPGNTSPENQLPPARTAAAAPAPHVLSSAKKVMIAALAPSKVKGRKDATELSSSNR